MPRHLVLALTLFSVPAWSEPAAIPKGSAYIPGDADEGTRRVERLVSTFSSFVSAQPYGRRWQDIVHVDAAPSDSASLGRADTHPSLSADTIEMQNQVQFLEPMKTEVRFGLVSIRGVRVYRYGRLVGAQLELNRIGRRKSQDRAWAADLERLRAFLSDPVLVLGLDKNRFRVTRNDVADKSSSLPLRVELEVVRQKE